MPKARRRQQIGRGMQKTAARIERHRLASKENNLFVTGASGITAHNQVTVGVKVEYSRQLKGNFYWGVDFSARWHLGSLMSYDWSGHGSDPYRNTVAQDIYKLDAMAYYRLPVVKSRLFLRFGAGVGAGYHRILKHVDNDLDKDRVLPFFNVECAWILRVTKGFELKFFADDPVCAFGILGVARRTRCADRCDALAYGCRVFADVRLAVLMY